MLKTWGLVISTASPTISSAKPWKPFPTNTLRSSFDLSQPSIDLFAISTSITPFAHPIRVQHNSNCSWKLFFFDIYIYRWKFFFFFRGKRRMRFFSITIKLISWKDRWWILEGINENDNSKGANDAFNIELVVPVGHCLSIVSRPSLPLYRSPPRIIEIF